MNGEHANLTLQVSEVEQEHLLYPKIYPLIYQDFSDTDPVEVQTTYQQYPNGICKPIPDITRLIPLHASANFWAL